MYFLDVFHKRLAERWLGVDCEALAANRAAFQISVTNQVRRKLGWAHPVNVA